MNVCAAPTWCVALRDGQLAAVLVGETAPRTAPAGYSHAMTTTSNTSTRATPRRRAGPPPRPPRGSGTVKQRPNRAGWTAYWSEAGKTRTKGGFATADDARAYLAIQVARSGRGMPYSTQTVAQFVEVFLADVEAQLDRGDKKASTVSTYRNTLGYVTRDPLGGMPLRDVRGVHVGAFYNRLRRNGKRNGGKAAEGTVKAVHRVLTTMLRHAVEVEVINASQVGAVPKMQRVKARNKARQAQAVGGDAVGEWRWETIVALCDATAAEPTPERVACCLAAAGSLRVGEVCGLEWRDVDLDDAVPFLRVTRARSIVDGRAVTGEPKTDMSTREISLVPQLAAVLTAWRAAQREALTAHGVSVNGLSPVVSHIASSRPPRGEPSHPGDHFRSDTLSRRTFDTLHALGLPAVDGLHALRHVFGFVFLNYPVNGGQWGATTVANTMGHSDPAITLSTYNRSTKNLAREMVAASMGVTLPSGGR